MERNNPFLFTEDMVIYVGNSKESTKPPRTKNGLWQGYRIQKSMIFLYTTNKQVYFETKNRIPFSLLALRYNPKKICIRSMRETKIIKSKKN